VIIWCPSSDSFANFVYFVLNRTTYAKVAGKYQDVLTLESSVAELHQMFLDFALLTEQQGELLDQIEFQVKQAGDYIEDANVDVYESIQYQSSIRKKQW
jgi:t-SNARE complex subunit (syntaxin)